MEIKKHVIKSILRVYYKSYFNTVITGCDKNKDETVIHRNINNKK